MLFKCLIMVFGIIAIVNSQFSDLEAMYLNFFVQLESVKKSVDHLKLQMEMRTEKNSCNNDKPMNSVVKYLAGEEAKNRIRAQPKTAFDTRFDTLPKHCDCDDTFLPSNCAKATDCTHASGYYNITVSRYRNHSFMAFCDIKSLGGDWLYILRRLDGSENFTRPWSDYVNGFGDVVKEYWIGLENLYALTNFDGPQELYIYLENWKGESRYAKYDYFVIGKATEKYKLKSLGNYTGDAGDQMKESIGNSFSTYDADNDPSSENCAKHRKGGWWYANCGTANPTGFYHRGGSFKYPSYSDGMFWKNIDYSDQIVNIMIRRQKL